MKRVPWAETFMVTSAQPLPDLKNQDVAREKAFHDNALECVKEGYRRLKSLGIPASRPGDFLAEMLKTDSQMFNKKSQAAKSKKKAEQKKENMKQVNNWKKNAN